MISISLRTTRCIFGAAATLVMVGCGGGDSGEPASLTPAQQAIKDQIVSRQSNLSDLGAAFKAIGDEVRAGRPTSTTVEFSAQSVARYADQIGGWFPEGSGPDSGLETDAKEEIWTNPEAFAEAVSAFEVAAADLLAAVESGDGAMIAQNFQKTGGTCKGCHDDFRKE